MAYYGVWTGKKTGIYTDWNECLSQVKGFKGAKYKKLSAKNMESAKTEFSKGYEAAQKNEKKKKPKTEHKIRDLHKNKGLNFFCDGACQKNPGPCSSGVAMYRDGILMKLYSGRYIVDGSNNVGELEAILFCLKKVKEINKEITIYSDSQYAISATSLWAYNWSKNNWMKDGEPVKNKELIMKCFSLYKEVKHLVKLEKVKSHIGELGNELADRMAIAGFLAKEKEWAHYKKMNMNDILKIEYP